jgi:hypothetical protein
MELYACTEEENDPNKLKYPPKKQPKFIAPDKPKGNKGFSQKEPQKVCHHHICLNNAGLCTSKCEKFGSYERHDNKCSVTNPSKPEKQQYPSFSGGSKYNEEPPAQSWHDTTPAVATEKKPYRPQAPPFIS